MNQSNMSTLTSMYIPGVCSSLLPQVGLFDRFVLSVRSIRAFDQFIRLFVSIVPSLDHAFVRQIVRAFVFVIRSPIRPFVRWFVLFRSTQPKVKKHQWKSPRVRRASQQAWHTPTFRYDRTNERIKRTNERKLALQYLNVS